MIVTNLLSESHPPIFPVPISMNITVIPKHMGDYSSHLFCIKSNCTTIFITKGIGYLYVLANRIFS